VIAIRVEMIIIFLFWKKTTKNETTFRLEVAPLFPSRSTLFTSKLTRWQHVKPWLGKPAIWNFWKFEVFITAFHVIKIWLKYDENVIKIWWKCDENMIKMMIKMWLKLTIFSWLNLRHFFFFFLWRNHSLTKTDNLSLTIDNITANPDKQARIKEPQYFGKVVWLKNLPLSVVTLPPCLLFWQLDIGPFLEMDQDFNQLVFELGLDYEMQNSMLQAANKVIP
jgi:hypothetical protein